MPFCIGTMTVLGVEQVVQLFRDRGDLVRLHGEDDHVLRPSLGEASGGLDARGDVVGAVGHREPHAPGADRLQVRAARDERHVLAGDRELDADVSADRAGTDDAEFHGWRSPWRTDFACEGRRSTKLAATQQ